MSTAEYIGAEDQTARLENLLTMGRRLADAIAADIGAIERGALAELATTDPEISRLAALYARDVAALKAAGGIGRAPRALTAALRDVGIRLKSLLLRHERLVAVMREASEGLIQTIAEEVDKTRKRTAPYSAKPKTKRGSGNPIVYNKVV
jgi:hypothetical protein